MTVGTSVCYARYMRVSDQELLHQLSLMPLADTAELAMIMGEVHFIVNRTLTWLLSLGTLGGSATALPTKSNGGSSSALTGPNTRFVAGAEEVPARTRCLNTRGYANTTSRANKETHRMPRRRRPSMRVILNATAVWEMKDQLDLSQNQLARLAGLSSKHLSQLMNGKSSPSPRARRQLQQALGVDDFHQLFLIVPVDDNSYGDEGE